MRAKRTAILCCSWTSPLEVGMVFVYANIFFECGAVATRIERAVSPGRARSPGLLKRPEREWN